MKTATEIMKKIRKTLDDAVVDGVLLNVVVVIVVVFDGNDVTKFCSRPRLAILETQPQHQDVLKTLLRVSFT
jgi:hypothetical protein